MVLDKKKRKEKEIDRSFISDQSNFNCTNRHIYFVCNDRYIKG